MNSGAKRDQSSESGGSRTRIGIVIPAYDEEGAIAGVVERCHRALDRHYLYRIAVGDNGSQDATASRARAAGAEVVSVAKRGYGAACRGAIAILGDFPEILVFVDGDGSSRPEEIPALVEPILRREAVLTLGRRASSAAMTLPQKWGTRLAVLGINLRWRQSFRDIGPFRAIRRDAFEQLGLKDDTWGWTVEMQILAARQELPAVEVDVSWENRIAGVSKISGTVSGVTRAGARILWTLFKYGLRPS